MRSEAAVGLIALLLAGLSPAADPPDRLAARKEAWQKALDRTEFRAPGDLRGLQYSLSQYHGDCRFHLTYDPSNVANRWRMRFAFERGGKELIVLHGHWESEFRCSNNVLYFARFSASSAGCTVAAYDLTSGKKLWETELKAIQVFNHSAYSNEVAMSVGSLDGVDRDGEGYVQITGRESAGDYIEVLDGKTGARLAHRVYRDRFRPLK